MRFKQIFTIFTFFGVLFFNAQVVIGKDFVSSPSVSLEFGSANKGLILPWVTSSASVTPSVDGTLIFDVADRKVKYKKSNSWIDLSVKANGFVDTTLQDNLTESSNAKTVIGADNSTDATSGILVLTDNDKAMVLPKVASPHLNISNPSPGMIVYDTDNRQMAVYNGTVWTFWKPSN